MEDTLLARKVAARFSVIASKPELLETKNTGNYTVRLMDDGDTPFLRIRYSGKSAGGDEVEVWLEPDSDYEIEDITKWFKALRGDHDIEELLAEAGYDTYTNPISKSKSRSVEIRL